MLPRLQPVILVSQKETQPIFDTVKRNPLWPSVLLHIKGLIQNHSFTLKKSQFFFPLNLRIQYFPLSFFPFSLKTSL